MIKKRRSFHWIKLREGVKGKMKNHCRNGVQLCGKPESKRAKQTTWILIKKVQNTEEAE
jgi:hypothetical protein